MKTEKLMTAALAVLTEYDDQDKRNYAPFIKKETIDRLRGAAHRRCETCEHFSPQVEAYDIDISGFCRKESHTPPRDLDDTCKRWKERA